MSLTQLLWAPLLLLLIWLGCRTLLIPYLSPVPEHLLQPMVTLPACPASPNCVRSGSEHWPVWPGNDHSLKQISLLIEQLPGCRIQRRNDHQLHATCHSQLWGFIDDLELIYDSQKGVIHYRSASRLGHSDLGVNARRIERLAELRQMSQR